MKDKLNACVTCEKKEKYFDLFVEFNGKDGKPIKILVRPITRDKKELAKLMYKIYMNVGE